MSASAMMIIRISGSYSEVNSIVNPRLQHKILLMSTTPQPFNKIFGPLIQVTKTPLAWWDSEPCQLRWWAPQMCQLTSHLSRSHRICLARGIKSSPHYWSRKRTWLTLSTASAIIMRSLSGARIRSNHQTAEEDHASEVSLRMAKSGKFKFSEA